MTMNDYMKKPIPILDDPKLYEAHDFIDSPLVEVKASDKIDIVMQYPILGFKNGEERALLRKEVAEMLEVAASKLPEGYKFRIWDCWRPFALQEELFIEYSKEIIEEFHLEELTKEEQHAFIGKFVSNPIPNKELPPFHTTGGAIDLTIVDPDGNELEMGCEFDEFTNKTVAAYYEMEEAKDLPNAEAIRNNRRFLYNVMMDAGFKNLPSEWWHFDYGDKNWAYAVDSPALYDGIFEY